MYVDEVGNPDLESAENPNHRFLSLTGVIISLDVVKNQLHPAFERIKVKYFNHHPDDPVIFHRKEMVNKKHPFKSLRDDTICKKFDDELIKILRDIEYRVITVLIDKLEHGERYKSWKYDPYHYCMAILLERYILFLERSYLIGDVLSESRGGKEDMRLKKSFRRLCDEGTQYITSERINKVLTSSQLKVKPKINNIAGLQLADIIAHPSRREILIENGKITDIRDNLFSDKIIEILQQKYDREGEKLFGKKLLP